MRVWMGRSNRSGLRIFGPCRSGTGKEGEPTRWSTLLTFWIGYRWIFVEWGVEYEVKLRG